MDRLTDRQSFHKVGYTDLTIILSYIKSICCHSRLLTNSMLIVCLIVSTFYVINLKVLLQPAYPAIGLINHSSWLCTSLPYCSSCLTREYFWHPQALLLVSTGTTFDLCYRQYSWYLVLFWWIKKTFSMELWVIVRIKIIIIKFVYTRIPLRQAGSVAEATSTMGSSCYTSVTISCTVVWE